MRIESAALTGSPTRRTAETPNDVQGIGASMKNPERRSGLLIRAIPQKVRAACSSGYRGADENPERRSGLLVRAMSQKASAARGLFSCGDTSLPAAVFTPSSSKRLGSTQQATRLPGSADPERVNSQSLKKEMLYIMYPI